MSIEPQRGISDVARCTFVFQTRLVAARRAIKVLSDLSIVLPLRVYRHSGPIGPGAAFWVVCGCRAGKGYPPVPPAHLGHPASDKKRGGQTPAVMSIDTQQAAKRSGSPSCL